MSVLGTWEFFVCAILLLLQTSRPVSAANTGAAAHPPNNTDWTGWGGNIYNNRWASTNTEINSTTIGQLVQNCKLDYPTGVSATPVVLNDTVYYPTSNGSFYALDIGTCDYVWQINVTKICWDFSPLSELQQNNSLPISRTSPQIDGNVLYFATQANALLVAVDLSTGDLLATIQVHDHPLAILTMSPTVYEGKIFIGASSQEESASVDPGYDCCNFIGNFAAFSFAVGTKKFTQVWNINTLPAGKGWSGASVWGSQPSIDPVRNQVFVGTGNTYVYPAEYEKCVNQSASCLPSDVWQESVLAVDIPSGKVNWRKSISSLDGWVMVCGYAGAATTKSPLCPGRPGPDADFGMAPTFVPAALGAGTTGIDSVVVGQKNGYIYNFNAVTGDIQWNVLTSPDADSGGLSWGLAVDDTQIYFTAINFGSRNLTLQPTGGSVNNSAFGAASLKTGEFIWETPSPDDQLAYTPPGVVNDLVFVGQSGSDSVTIPGAVLALSKTTGSILQSWPVDSVQHGGITVQGGFMMFGTGYHYENPFNNGSFYVYGLPDAITAAKTKPPRPTVTIVGAGNPTTTPSNLEGGTGTQSGSTDKKSAAIRMSSDVILSWIYPWALLAFILVW
jgi:polyvinyl alcohol dehydrogenase (cytochrome)